MKLPLCKFILASFVVLLFVNFTFAQVGREQGIELYDQSDYQGAIAVLKNSDEVKDLYYLGLAYEKINKIGNAKDAFKKSFVESYDVFFKKFNEWQKKYKDNQKTNFSDLLQEVKVNNQIGLVAAEKAFNLKSDIFQTSEWRVKAKVLLDTVNLAKTQTVIYSFSDKPISTVEIIEKPQPPFPRDIRGIPIARLNQSPNKPITVTLFAIFGTDEEIKLLIPTEDLIDAYTLVGLEAASKIKFKPATKDNKPIVYHRKIEYHFSFR